MLQRLPLRLKTVCPRMQKDPEAAGILDGISYPNPGIPPVRRRPIRIWIKADPASAAVPLQQIRPQARLSTLRAVQQRCSRHSLSAMPKAASTGKADCASFGTPPIQIKNASGDTADLRVTLCCFAACRESRSYFTRCIKLSIAMHSRS